MRASPRRAVIEHDARLSILCCLLSSPEPLDFSQVSAGTGLGSIQVKHHVRILDAFRLVKKQREVDSGKTRYAAQLDVQPYWVRAAIQVHCPRQRSSDGG
jgi:hypothetical protein